MCQIANISNILMLCLWCFCAALNYRLLTIHGLDEAQNLHGVYLNGKYFISCEQKGEGPCNVGTPETWNQARDKASTITAIEVPIYPETGLETTDQPTSPLTRLDNKGRAWGGNKNKNWVVISVLVTWCLFRVKLPHPCWFPLEVLFKFSDKRSRPFYMEVPSEGD